MELVLPHDEQDTGNNRDDSGTASNHLAGRADLFKQNKHGQRRDPKKIHDAGNEEDDHQSPAAAQTIHSVPGSHAKRAVNAVTLIRHEKT